MSCPDCGCRIGKNEFIVLIVSMVFVICSFAASLFFLPFEIFFLVSLLLLYVLHVIEKKIIPRRNIARSCPKCGKAIPAELKGLQLH